MRMTGRSRSTAWRKRKLGIIGSSNLSHAALLDGCEWNVRFSMVDQ
jgi:HKD family nuclease